uniref:Uncharacterized protein n=1 Tax=Daphnia magna TaxID=35525 RepID=A0A0P5DXS9_9CRUS
MRKGREKVSFFPSLQRDGHWRMQSCLLTVFFYLRVLSFPRRSTVPYGRTFTASRRHWYSVGVTQ